MSRIRVSPYVHERIRRSKEDFEVQTFRSGGKGGMNQNKVSSGVRIIDKKTGLRTECREERSQHQNKMKAFDRMVDLLLEHYQKEEREQAREFSNDSVVRHYNEKDSRVKDERLPGLEFDYDSVLDGKLEKMMQALREAEASAPVQPLP